MKTNYIPLLITLLLAPLAASHAATNAPGPTLEVFHRETETCETATFERGASLFSDRPLYKMSEPPAELKGQPFLRASIDGVRVRCTEAGTITAIAPPSVPLELYGFERIFEPASFQLFGTNAHERVQLYRKTLEAGETLELGKYCILLGFKKLTAKAFVKIPWTQNAGERLYNGIQLPEEWPPRFRDPTSDEPMEVPYLKDKPKVIPIDIGRQLFVDDFLIEKTTLKRTFHQAKKFAGNPVFKAETEMEKKSRNTVYLGQGGVFYEPKEKLFKMFYSVGLYGPLAMATSPDLKTWTRPELGLHGGNILRPPGRAWGNGEGTMSGSDNALWYDIQANDPKERIKYLTCWMHVPKEQLVPGLTHSLQVSDGVTWSKPVPCTRPAGDYCSIFYNPFRKKWVQSIKKDTPRGRSRYYVESDTFLEGANWDKAVYWTNADRLDLPEPAGSYAGNEKLGAPPQLYSLAAVAYESLMIGMHQIHRGPNNDLCGKGGYPKLTDLELGFSRDGFHWDRPDRRGFIRGERREGAWDRAYLHTTTGVVVVLDDQLVFPYCGYSGDAGGGRGDMYGGGAIGLATLRRDGFASMEAGEKPGELTTRLVKFRGKHLFVNLIGELRVELLDEAGKLLATSKTVSGDTTKQRIEWTDRADLSALSGKPVRFRFHLTHGQLFAFWVTPDPNGASNGYVAAGGPGYTGITDTAGELK
jgi:hypothetical protein